MAICINKNSVQYQSLKNRAGISEFVLEAISRDFMEKYGRLPHLDELPSSNSEPYLRDQLGVTKYNSAKVDSILEMTGKKTVEEAVIDINNQFRDLETTIIPINKEALVDIVHRPTEDNFDNWSEEDEILAKAPRDDSGNLLAPNGRISNLTEKQYVQVRTKAFKKWFGDWENNPENASKVVDENGEPLVVYHGGENNINIFQTYHKDADVGDMYGSYFTKDEKYAKTYEKGKIYPVFLNIKNPLVTEGSWTGVINDASVFEQYDGIINNKFDNGILQKLHLQKSRSEIIIRKPNQIKSATDNSGSFNRLSGNIYDTEPNGYLVLNNAIQKLASLYGITFNTVTDAELNSERWRDLMPESKLVNAFVYDGQIYINVDRASLDAPLHEMLHIFVGSMRFTNPDFYYELIQLAEKLPNYNKLASQFSGKTRNDINEEIFITELAKHLTNQDSALTNLDDRILYEISYNVHRLLDSVLMGSDSSKVISDNRLYNLSLKDLAAELNSAIMINNRPPLKNSELHRILNNMKSDLIKEGKLKEICD